jgi:competence protein ComQ
MMPPRDMISAFDPSPFITAVDEELHKRLIEYSEILPPSLILIGKMALSGPGKVMSRSLVKTGNDSQPQITPRWPLYVLLSYQAAQPSEQRDKWQEAVPAAAAAEIAMAAADLLDELTDDDPSPIAAKYGAGQALNTANLMLVMAQQVLQKHAHSGGGERALNALGALQDMLVQAAVGQHLDMLYDDMGPTEVTPEMSAHMTSLKAGALIAGACRMGALMSGADAHVVELLARFGKEIGGIAQIVNDIQDVLPHETTSDAVFPEPKTDLRLRKRTLPVVFTLRDDSPEPNALQRTFSDPQAGPVDEEELRQAVLSAGGVQFAQLVIQVHEQNALGVLQELESLRPGARQVLAPLMAAVDQADAEK